MTPRGPAAPGSEPPPAACCLAGRPADSWLVAHKLIPVIELTPEGGRGSTAPRKLVEHRRRLKKDGRKLHLTAESKGGHNEIPGVWIRRAWVRVAGGSSRDLGGGRPSHVRRADEG